MTRPVNYLAHYRAAVKAFDLAAVRAVVLDMLGMEELVLPHPDYPDVVTTCRSGQIGKWDNILFLSDALGGNRWCLVQHTDLFVGTVSQEGVDHFGPRESVGSVDRAYRQFREGFFDERFERDDTFGGLMSAQVRPFHFFYDQMIHLPLLEDPDGAPFPLAVGKNFFDPSLIANVRPEPVREQCYYLLSTLAAGYRSHSRAPKRFFRQAEIMERRVEAAAPRIERSFPAEATILWIGITGQKRSWLEQVEGYTAIINAVAKVSPGLGIFIDGMTAQPGEWLSVPEDESVAAAIRDRLCPEVRVTSLIGLDYATKIAYCRHVDAFIANGGTGCLVPLRFCRKPGVVHSNTEIRFFAKDRYSNVAFVEKEFIRDEAGQDTVRTSYHIAWQHIHNLLAAALRTVGKASPDPLPEPDVTTLVTREN